MESIRSFIAIELPGTVRSGLSRLQGELKTGGHSPVKWVNPENIHLTLKFLGSLPVDKIEAITGAMDDAARGIPPFRLEVRGLGVFPDLRRVRVVWVGVSGELAKLGQLQKRIDSHLTPFGFAAESRPFTPHLTLARVREQASPDELLSFGRLIAGTDFTAAYAFNVDAINLMKSQLTRTGAIYSRINSVRLTGRLSTNTD